MHTVSDWASDNRLGPGQQKVAGDSNRMTTVPALLERSALTGCIVTLGAMHCQTGTVDAIRAQEADHLITVRGDQAALHREIREASAAAHASAFLTLASERWKVYCVGAEERHRRREMRTYRTVIDPPVLAVCNLEMRMLLAS
ncbi:MAG: ISAs1 family transposase [Roseiflexus sp.]